MTSEKPHPDPELSVYDGTIQALYGVALKLEESVYLVDEKPHEAKASLEQAMARLYRVIETVRERLDHLNK